jgi:hypothetical protein
VPGGKAFEIRDISDGRGGSAKGFILWNPFSHQTVDVDGDTIGIWIMPKIAENHGFLTRKTVEVCEKSPFYSIFKAKSLDFGGIGNNIRKKCFSWL